MTRRASLLAVAALLAAAFVHDAEAARPLTPLPALAATFTATSYAPGALARLRVTGEVRRVELQVLRAGAERAWSSVGRPWGPPEQLRFRRGTVNTVLVRLGAWSSGLYFARLTAPGGRAVAFAPFVVRPAVPGAARVAVIIPTYSWQAYNFYDANRDGRGDSWYVDSHRHSVVLGRPFAGNGKPPHYRTQQRGFLRMLVHTGRQADYLTDEDLEQVASGDDLAHRYDAIFFSGHEEYVTTHIYDVIQRYRDLGGNLLFMSANNFFRRVDRGGGRLRLVGLWRDLGRPEAALCGVQYAASDRGKRQAPYTVTGADLAPWAFEGTGLVNGSRFGLYGIEIDSTTPSSPTGTQVLARIPDLLGPGRTAEMTYYESPSGARVFSAGAMNFGGQIALWPEAQRLFENVWARLAPPGG